MSQQILLVEGADDSNALYHLLKRYDVPIAERGRAFPDRLSIEQGDGFEHIIKTLEIRLRAIAGDDPPARLGLVLDADHYPDQRWQSVTSRLREIGYQSLPPTPHPDGTIVVEARRPIVGIWLMPNNHRPGALEEFAHLLIEPNDPLWPRAQAVVQAIPVDERRFGIHAMKATLHTWLAWQEEPGKPIGQAITKRYLNPDTDTALSFVAWVRRLITRDLAA